MRDRVGRAARDLRVLPVRIGYTTGPKWASNVRMAWIRFRNPHADIRFGRDVYLGPGFSLHMPYGGSFHAGDKVEFRRNFRAELGGPASTITIGDGSVFTYDAVIQCTTSISIGQRCTFGQTTMMVDGNHNYRDPDTPLLDMGYEYRPLVIEDLVTSMSKVTIVNSIGRRAVVGANAVVTKPIPAYTLAVGVPARPVDYFGPAGEEPPGFSAANSDRSGRPE